MYEWTFVLSLQQLARNLYKFPKHVLCPAVIVNSVPRCRSNPSQIKSPYFTTKGLLFCLKKPQVIVEELGEKV